MSGGPIEVDVVSSTGPELDALVPEWDELARSCGQGYSCRPTYGLSWWAELGVGELHLVAARRAGKLVAIAPLHRRTLLGQPVLRWLGHGLGTVGRVVASDLVAAGAVWSVLASERTPLQLTHVQLDDPATMALRRSAHTQVLLTVDDLCPVLPLPAGLRARDLRSARSLKRLAGYRTALEREQGAVDVEVVTDLDGLHARWPDIVRVAADADRERSRQNLCAPPYDRFTLAFLEAEARAGGLLVLGLTVGGRWVAHEIGVRHRTRLDLWLSRLDPALDRYPLGHLLAHWLVEQHDELGVELLDMGLGENAYKLAWTTSAYDVGTVLSAPSGLGRVRAQLALAQQVGEVRRRVPLPRPPRGRS